MEEDGPSGAPCGEHQESQEEFECPICQEVFRTPIRTKSCGHVFCRSCFVAAVRTRGPSCPLCRGPVCEDEKRAADVQRQMRERKGSCRACGALCFLSRMRTHYRYCRKYAEEYGGPPAAVALPGARAGDPNGAGASPIEGPLSMYCCPYCPLQGLRDTALVQHCLGSHPTARSPAVCPICAATSWGDASYRSGNFIGHLRLRHRFSYNNYMVSGPGGGQRGQAASPSLQPAQNAFCVFRARGPETGRKAGRLLLTAGLTLCFSTLTFVSSTPQDMNEDEDVQVNRALQESRCPDVAVLTPSP
uniref:E3 ubiquitin-protein ligase RNF166 n=1 Tax=Scleropages formosus TaxID=113540 RepID=A0A8C9R9V6_SCLFO